MCLPASTRRRARSRVISATWQWRSGVRSNVEAMTSPKPHISISVTSSGRSSTQEDHQFAFRVVPLHPLCDGLQDGGLSRLRGCDDQRPLPLPHGTEEVDHPIGHVRFAGVNSAALQLELVPGVHRAQPVEVRSPGSAVGSKSVHLLQVAERRALPVARAAPHDAGEFVSRAQPEPVDEAGSDVDVVAARHIPVLRAADETRAARQDLQNAEELPRLAVVVVAPPTHHCGPQVGRRVAGRAPAPASPVEGARRGSCGLRVSLRTRQAPPRTASRRRQCRSPGPWRSAGWWRPGPQPRFPRLPAVPPVVG